MGARAQRSASQGPGRAGLRASALAAAGVLLGVVVRVWVATLRVRVLADAALDAERRRPWVLVFFHGKQMALLAWPRRRKTSVMVSLSRDGALQAGVMRLQGLLVVRGSTSRGGAAALAAVVRRIRSDAHDAAFAVDGPRGPYGHVHDGALAAARLANAVLVPLGSSMARGHVFRRAWDRFELPWPFSRVVVTLGAPLEPSDHASPSIRRAIEAANDRATMAQGFCLDDASSLPRERRA